MRTRVRGAHTNATQQQQAMSERQSQEVLERVTAALSVSSVSFRSSFDAVSWVVHNVFTARGARLVALSEDAAEQSLEALPVDWNANTALYCFVYRFESLPHPIVLKMLPMGRSLHVHATSKGGSQIYSVELVVDDYVASDVSVNSDAFSNLQALVLLADDRVVSKLAPAPPRSANMASSDSCRQPRDPSARGDPMSLPQRPFASGGDFSGDLMPDFGPFGPMPGVGQGGNMAGPDHPLFVGRGRGRSRLGPRFDPFGPGPGLGGDPDRDDLPPPGPGRFPDFTPNSANQFPF